jgi:hypothetical protein
MRKVFGAVLCVLVATTVLGLANPVEATAADSGAESAFVSRINGIRSSKGLGPLQVYGELVGIARGWSDSMAAQQNISHNPSYTGQVSANWSKLGENVGVGYDVDGLMNAFVNSPAHYKNIVDPAYNYIGLGVSYGNDGRMYVTQDFMAMGEAPAPAPAPEPDPSPAPAPTPRANRSTPPAPAPAPVAEDAPPVPPPVPAPPAAPTRVAVVLQALRAVSA